MKTLMLAAQALMALALAAVVALSVYEAIRALSPPPAPPVPRRYVHPIWIVPLPHEEGGDAPCTR